MKKLFKNTLKNKEMNNYADSWQPLKMVAFSRLYNINIPDNITMIMDNTFYKCKSLKEITMSDKVIYLMSGVFSYCDSLMSITIPDTVAHIDYGVFYKCKSLTSITIPDNITDIGVDVFYGCESLKAVIFKGKTLDDVKQMQNYPFGIEDESIFKFS